MGRLGVTLESRIICWSTIICSPVFFHIHGATLHHSFIWRRYQCDIMTIILYLHSLQSRVARIETQCHHPSLAILKANQISWGRICRQSYRCRKHSPDKRREMLEGSLVTCVLERLASMVKPRPGQTGTNGHLPEGPRPAGSRADLCDRGDSSLSPVSLN